MPHLKQQCTLQHNKPLMVFFVLPCLLLMAFTVHAFEQRDFANAKDKALFDTLVAELRCLVCQNQNIADSQAELAVDLRREIFTMIEAGQDKSEITDFMVQRYGEFVLYKPRLTARTLVLWLGPAILLLVGVFIVWRSAKRKPTVTTNQPDTAALKRARDLLDSQE